MTGTPRATFEDHFSGHAEAYARSRPRYPEALLAWAAGLPEGPAAALAPRRAWDAATGNGQAAAALAAHVDEVVATDASAAQVERFDAPANVRAAVGTAEAPDPALLPAGSVALVTVAQALHWFDQRRFFAAAHRVLAEGGALVGWFYGRCRVGGVEGDAANVPDGLRDVLGRGPIDRALDDVHDLVLAGWWPERRRLVLEGGRSIAPWPASGRAARSAWSAIAAPDFDMTAAWTMPELLDYVGTWSAAQRFERARGIDVRRRLAARLERHWGDPAVRRTVRWPLAVRAWRRG